MNGDKAMLKQSTLEIRGYNNEDVPNTFWKQAGAAQHLAIALPGYGYTADMPALYYPGHLITSRGGDLLQVQYNYSKNPEYERLEAGGQAAWLYADAMAACFAGLSQGTYQRVTLIGKSLGTIAMAHLLGDKPEFTVAECVWLTPVLDDLLTFDRLLKGGERGLVLIGTEDPYYQPDQLTALQKAANLTVQVHAQANHSLELPGDIPGSIRILEKIIDQIDQFIFT
jgi:pimeloyl-ACP methyl ester carboxylesterase